MNQNSFCSVGFAYHCISQWVSKSCSKRNNERKHKKHPNMRDAFLPYCLFRAWKSNTAKGLYHIMMFSYSSFHGSFIIPMGSSVPGPQPKCCGMWICHNSFSQFLLFFVCADYGNTFQYGYTCLRISLPPPSSEWREVLKINYSWWFLVYEVYSALYRT